MLSNHEPVPSPILLLRVLFELLKCLIAQLDRILFDDVANAPKSQHVTRLYDYALKKITIVSMINSFAQSLVFAREQLQIIKLTP